MLFLIGKNTDTLPSVYASSEASLCIAIHYPHQVIPVASWGITTALNACLHEAARLSVQNIAFQSVELAADAGTPYAPLRNFQAKGTPMSVSLKI